MLHYFPQDAKNVFITLHWINTTTHYLEVRGKDQWGHFGGSAATESKSVALRQI